MAELDPSQITKDAEASYQKALPQAQSVDARELIRFNADTRIAQHNVTRIVETLAPLQESISKRLSSDEAAALQKNLSQAPTLAQALLFSDLEVDRHRKGSPGETQKKLSEARELRGLLLDGARTCARAKRIDAEEVRKIERGRGPFDVAEDCIALASLYRSNAQQMSGATPVTPEQIKRAAELGTELSALFTPANSTAKTKNSDALSDAMDIRDRLWTLLSKTHEALWSAAALHFGYSVYEHVPSLQSRATEVKPKTA